MPLRPTTHLQWQILRTVLRNGRKKPLTGRQLRIVPSRNTKDGSFLTVLVDLGLLAREAGTAELPFEATYTLTEKGKHTAEYGEYEFQWKPKPAAVTAPAPPPAPAPKPPVAKKKK